MKARKILLTMFALFVCLAAHAYDVKINGIYYNITEDDATVTFQDNSNGTYTSDYAGDIVIPETITYNGDSYPVTAIGQNAFNGCSSVTSIVIPESVNYIGYSAFRGCSGLITLTLPESVESIGNGTLSGCSSLMSLRIPYGLSQIDTDMLSGCTSLQSLSIPGSVTYIAQSAFNDCTSLQELRLEDATSKLTISYNYYINSYTGYHAFSKCPLESVYIGRDLSYDTDVRYGYSPFYNKTNLTNVTIGNDVTAISSNLFMYCTGLTSITIPSNVKTIGTSAFESCGNLNDLQLSEGLENIYEQAFYWCDNLTMVNLPNSLMTIGDKAFYSYNGLSSVVIPSNVTSIGANPFCGNNLTSIIVSPENPIYDSRDNCNAIIFTEADSMIVACPYTTLPDGLKAIGGYDGCKNLTSITIPDGVSQISTNAFWGCSGLNIVTIPASVTKIGAAAFSYCTGLTDIYCHVIEPLSINNLSGTNLQNATLHVPASSIDKYCDAYIWRDFGAYMTLDGSQIEKQEVVVNGIKYRIGLNATVIRNTNNYSGDISIPSSITVNGNTYSVTSIGESAFASCTGLTSVSLPSSVTKIGREAFSGCIGLTSLTLPSGLKTIDNYAFHGCSGLFSLSIPNNVTTIGEEFMWKCLRTL